MYKFFQFLILFQFLFGQGPSSLKTWESILQTPELISYFNGIFNHLGVVIDETGESFTIHHTGDAFIFEEGIIKDKVDFIVPLQVQNIEKQNVDPCSKPVDVLRSSIL